MSSELPMLCESIGCRRLRNHQGNHDSIPTEAWDFLLEKDKNKLSKAGFATPRGGEKGGYQNHVARSSQVVVPFERLHDVDSNLYQNGYVVRFLPEQYFEAPGVPRRELEQEAPEVVVGENAFVLYRTHESFRAFPPLEGWRVRSLIRDGQEASDRRGDVQDIGHYLLRLSRIGDDPKQYEGPPQGIFATEYADKDTNYLCKCVLAWLILQTCGSHYTLTQAPHLRAILQAENLNDANGHEYRGVLRHGLCCCPLCNRFIRYSELHSTVTFRGEESLANAGVQVQGATRSTIVNLFHLHPLMYHSLTHKPANVAWGHAICNTRLGQRRCFSLDELVEMDRKVGIIREEGIETFGWISEDWQMIRSPNGAVWIQLNGDVADGPPEEGAMFDAASEETE